VSSRNRTGLYAFRSDLIVALTVLAQIQQHGAPSFIISLAVAGIAYLLAIVSFFSTRIQQSRLVTGSCWLLYGVFHLY